MNYVKELKGVGGWLAFFIIALCVIGPMMAISSTFVAFQSFETSTPGAASLESWQNYKQYTWVVIAFSITLRVIAGFMLASNFKRISVRFTIAVLWITPLIAAIGSYIVALVTFGAEAASDNTDSIIDMAKGLAAAAVWTAYLLKSVRVKNTYYALGQ